jgi:putative hydrolase of the HAD superfamily
VTSAWQPAILADADNTLWDTDAVYAAAQLDLLMAVQETVGLSAPAVAGSSSRLQFLRGYDQALAATDHRGFRYPASLLVRSLVLGLRGLSPDEAAAAAPTGAGRTLAPDAIERLADRFAHALKKLPALLPTVRDGLRRAAIGGADVWVLTENDADLQRSRVLDHGLDGWIKGLAEVTKTSEQFSRQKRRFAPRTVIVIGDQPDRDVAPAQSAGCLAVLVPGRFRPISRTQAEDSDHVAVNFLEAVEWALAEPQGTGKRAASPLADEIG